MTCWTVIFAFTGTFPDFSFVILLTMALLIPLILYADQIKLVLAVNSYLNVMSVAVSSIVLLYATISEARQKQIARVAGKTGDRGSYPRDGNAYPDHADAGEPE